MIPVFFQEGSLHLVLKPDRHYSRPPLLNFSVVLIYEENSCHVRLTDGRRLRKEMTNEELQALTGKISQTYFLKPFKHQATFNPRLRTTGGRYMLESHNIEINRKYYEEHGMNELEGIIKHELCHYHLHIEGRGYKHRDPEFRKLLNEVGGPRHCTPLAKEREKRSVKRIYLCTKCGHRYERQRRVDTKRYSCGKCRGKLREKI